MSMTPEELAVIKAAQRLVRSGFPAPDDLRVAVQVLKISRQPEHTVEPVPCMKYSPNSAGMFCVLPIGHDADEIAEYLARYPQYGDNVPTEHEGYPGGVPGSGPNGGRRQFTHWPYLDTMEHHERPACPRFPGCERHP